MQLVAIKFVSVFPQPSSGAGISPCTSQSLGTFTVTAHSTSHTIISRLIDVGHGNILLRELALALVATGRATRLSTPHTSC